MTVSDSLARNFCSFAGSAYKPQAVQTLLDAAAGKGPLKAMDPVTGEVKWEYKNDAPLWGGVMTTAGGLVFFGTPEGEFKALNDETGEELWSFQTGSGIVGQPVTWEQDGEQYVSIVSGWGGAVPLWGGEVAKKVNYLNQGGMVWTFKLPAQLASN